MRAIVTLFAARCAICVQDTQSASEVCAFDNRMQDTAALSIAPRRAQSLAECANCVKRLGQLFLLFPFGPIAALHFVHLCSGHSKLLAFRCSELPHALQHELRMPTVLYVHSRAERPVRPHVLRRTRASFSGDAHRARVAYSNFGS